MPRATPPARSAGASPVGPRRQASSWPPPAGSRPNVVCARSTLGCCPRGRVGLRRAPAKWSRAPRGGQGFLTDFAGQGWYACARTFPSGRLSPGTRLALASGCEAAGLQPPRPFFSTTMHHGARLRPARGLVGCRAAGRAPRCVRVCGGGKDRMHSGTSCSPCCRPARP